MDNLARNAMLAKQAGMSYGKWKALQPVVPIEKKEVVPEGWIRCAYCNKPFKPHNPQQKYCEYMCRERGYAEKAKEVTARYQAKYRERKKEKKNEQV